MLQVIISEMPFEYINKNCHRIIICQGSINLSKTPSAFYFKSKSKSIPPNSNPLTEVPKAEE